MNKLNNTPAKQEYQSITYKLRKLQEFRKCVESDRTLGKVILPEPSPALMALARRLHRFIKILPKVA